MDYDLLLTVGVTLAILTIPSMFSAWSDGRAPRTATLILMGAGALIVTALTQSPKVYTIDGLPHLFVEVIARYMR